jgi:ankyrin repeat protein
MTRRRRRVIGNLNYQDPFGNTLLHGAVVSGDVEEVAGLRAAGADAGIANRDGRTALHAAQIFGHAEIENLLTVANVTSRAHSDTLTKPGDPRIVRVVLRR